MSHFVLLKSHSPYSIKMYSAAVRCIIRLCYRITAQKRIESICVNGATWIRRFQADIYYIIYFRIENVLLSQTQN